MTDDRQLRAAALRGLLHRLTAEGLTLDEARKVRAQLDLLMESRLTEPAPAASSAAVGAIAADELYGGRPTGPSAASSRLRSA